MTNMRLINEKQLENEVAHRKDQQFHAQRQAHASVITADKRLISGWIWDVQARR